MGHESDVNNIWMIHSVPKDLTFLPAREQINVYFENVATSLVWSESINLHSRQKMRYEWYQSCGIEVRTPLYADPVQKRSNAVCWWKQAHEEDIKTNPLLHVNLSLSLSLMRHVTGRWITRRLCNPLISPFSIINRCPICLLLASIRVSTANSGANLGLLTCIRN